MGRSINDYRNGRQPKVRSLVAQDAHFRNSAGAMGKNGKGRSRLDTRTRQDVKANLRRGEWD